MRDSELPIYTVYSNPRDYPGRYVIRRSVLVPGGGMRVDRSPLAVGATLEEVRAKLPPGLTQLARQAKDDPVIVEVWL